MVLPPFHVVAKCMHPIILQLKRKKIRLALGRDPNVRSFTQQNNLLRVSVPPITANQHCLPAPPICDTSLIPQSAPPPRSPIWRPSGHSISISPSIHERCCPSAARTARGVRALVRHALHLLLLRSAPRRSLELLKPGRRQARDGRACQPPGAAALSLSLTHTHICCRHSSPRACCHPPLRFPRRRPPHPSSSRDGLH
jgi:hypothetical protein